MKQAPLYEEALALFYAELMSQLECHSGRDTPAVSGTLLLKAEEENEDQHSNKNGEDWGGESLVVRPC
jgi:hypothetical protein